MVHGGDSTHSCALPEPSCLLSRGGLPHCLTGTVRPSASKTNISEACRQIGGDWDREQRTAWPLISSLNLSYITLLPRVMGPPCRSLVGSAASGCLPV